MRGPYVGALRSRNAVRALLLAYGIVFAVFGAMHLGNAIPDQAILMERRQAGIGDAVRVLNQGGPPLLASNNRALPGGDDPGMYLYAPLIGHAFGIQDPRTLVKRLFIGAFLVLLLLYPLLFYELFGSVAAGVASAPLLLYKFAFLQNTQLYWVTAWCLLGGLPVLGVVLKGRWRAASIVALTLTVMAAGVATSIRNHAGLPILVGGLIVVLLRERAWWRRATLALLLVVAYVALASVAVRAVERSRNAATTVYDTDVHSVLWHNAYIGLGYLANRDGIIYSDSAAVEAVARKDPKAKYLTDRYAGVIRRIYIHEVLHEPGFFLKNVGVKAIVVLQDASSRFWLTIFLLPLVLLFGPARRRIRWVLFLAVPAFLVSLLPPLLVIPIQQYELGWLGAWGFLWLLAATGSIALLARALVVALPTRDAFVDGLRKAVAESRAAPWLLSLVGAALVFLIVSTGPIRAFTGRIKDAYIVRQNQTPLLRNLPLAAPISAEWRFEQGLPPRWIKVSAITTRPMSRGLAITTDTTTGGYQLESNRIVLNRGRYQIFVDGMVVRGGLLVGVLNVRRDRWITVLRYGTPPLVRNPRFGALPGSFHQGYMGGSFGLDRRRVVQVILANGPLHGHSTWLIRRIELLRRGQPPEANVAFIPRGRLRASAAP